MNEKPSQPAIDWAKLARALGALRDDGSETGSNDVARLAIEQIIAPAAICDAVDYYVARRPGYELARSVLWVLHPWSGMQRCYEIYQTATDAEDRCSAVELLRVVADRRVLPWIPEFLADTEIGVQWCGASMLDQMLFSSLIEPEECADLLVTMAQHPNENVRSTHAFVQKYLAERASGDDTSQ